MNFGYKQIMQANSRDVHNAAISTKIIQLMDKMRDSSTEDQARRWVWELIQNAKDAAYPDKPVKIKIELFEDRMVFSHNGRPFLVKNILSIINQVSSKAADDPESTGKFGTGFISTHLLSEKVYLDGILQDYDINTKELLPAKKFSILLDRSGRNTEEIIASVQKSLDKIEQLDHEPDLTDFPEFTTSFTYMLDNGKKAAKIGIEDLKHSILYALAFVERLNEIQIINYIDNTRKAFIRANRNECAGYEGLSVLQIKEDEKTHNLLVLKQDSTILAAEFDDHKKFLPIHDKTPRIFVDFPLIGSENFPFPVVLCDRDLLPNEPRSFIPLSGNRMSQNSQNNKEILQKAVRQCNFMFQYAAELEYENFYEVCKIQPLRERADFDAVWYKNNILNAFWGEFSKLKIINTDDGKQTLNSGIAFPVSDSNNERNVIYELLAAVNMYRLPDKEEIQGWSDVFSLMETPPNYVWTLSRLAGSAKAHKEFFAHNKEYISWLQKLYYAVLNNTELADRLKTGDLKLLPDQNEETELHSIGEMYLDPNIDDAIKKAMCQFNIIAGYGNYERVDIYSILLHKDFEIGSISIKTYPVQELLNKIDSYSDQKLRAAYSGVYRQRCLEAWFNGWLYMLSCDKDRAWFDFACDVFPEDTKGLIYQPSVYAEQENIWKNSRLGVRELICSKIQEHNTFEKVKLHVLKTKKNETDWIFDFIDKGIDVGNIADFARYAIFPNQNNQFCYLSLLHRDSDIDEELKNIAFLISQKHDIRDFRNLLLHKAFKNNTTYVSFIYEKEVAADITRAIDAVLNTGGLSETDEQMQEACTILLGWIEEHPERAKELFTHYTSEEARMKLLTPRAAAKMSKRIKQMEQVLKECGIEDIEELRKIIGNVNAANTSADPVGLDELSQDERLYFGNDEGVLKEYCEKIGRTGERAAFHLLISEEMEAGAELIDQTDQVCVLKRDAKQIKIEYCDTKNYKQQGYDITKYITENGQTSCMYYEVKSTTREDHFRYISLSHSQFEYAMRKPEEYCVIRLLLTRYSLEIINKSFIWNLPKYLESGNIRVEVGDVLLRLS